ncbi:MAG: hypothetical protein IPP08_10790 [Chlorobiota bacterium]|nr:MAG: hypothetical protein IPP08_10790 [Chlorobiota bacterium]
MKYFNIFFLVILLSIKFCPAQSAKNTADSLIKANPQLFEPLKNDSNKIDSNKIDSIRSNKPIKIDSNTTINFKVNTKLIDSIKALRYSGIFESFVPIFEQIKTKEELPFISYDKADGFYIGIGSFDLLSMYKKDFGISVGFGYGFGSHYWQFKGGLSKSFGDFTKPTIVNIEGHILTDTKDAWKMSQTENIFSAMVMGRDARDYYNRNGFSIAVGKIFSKKLNMKIEYRNDMYSSLIRNVNWSIFGDKFPFSEVAEVYNGKLSSLIYRVGYDEVTNGENTWLNGIFGVEGEIELLLNDINLNNTSDNIKYKIIVTDIVYKNELFKNVISFAMHGRFGIGFGDVPNQKTFTVGGIGSLNGFNQNEFSGTRLGLIQTDMFFSLWNVTNLILTNDFCFISNPGSSSSLFSGLPTSINDIKYSFGIGFGGREGISMGYHFRGDIYSKPNFILRLAKRF